MALSLYAVNEGYIDDVPVNKVVDFETALHAFARGKLQGRARRHQREARVQRRRSSRDLKKILEAFKKTGTY